MWTIRLILLLHMKLFLLSLIVFSFVSCSASNMYAKTLSKHGTLLKRYTEGKDEYFIQKKNNTIIKYHLLNEVHLIKLYKIDTLTETCYAFDNSGNTTKTVLIPSDKLKKDKDMKPYITW